MKKTGSLRIYIFVILLFIFLYSFSFSQVSVSAKLSDDKIGVDEPFTLILTIEGGSGRVSMPDIEGLTMRGNSQSKSMVLSGGVFKSTQIFYYTFVAGSPGIYVIDKVDIKVKGSTYRANKVQVEVLDYPVRSPQSKRTPTGDEFDALNEDINIDDVYVENSINKKEVYVYEPVYISQTAYTRVPVRVLGISSIPDRTDFLSFSDSADYNSTRELINGKTFSVKPLKKEVLYPLKAGRKTIETTSYIFQNSGTIFYDQVERGKDKYEINVIPLPPKGINTNFSGAVGDFNFSVSLSKTNINIGEDLIITFEVKGDGNTSIIDMPDIDSSFSNYFTVYPPKIYETNSFKDNNITGVKTKEYLLIANEAGNFVFPKISFCYFSPSKKSYNNIHASELILNVFGDKNIITNAGVNKSQLDIIPIKAAIVKDNGVFTYLDVKYLYFYIAFVTILAVIIAVVKKINANNKNKKNNNKEKNDGFGYVREMYNKGNRIEYSREAETVFLTKISSILSISKKTTFEDILTSLKDKNINDNIIRDVKNLVDSCRFEEYSGESIKEKIDYHTKMIEIIEEIRKEIKG